MVVAARRGALLEVDRAVLGGAAQLLRRPLYALGEHGAEALAVRDHLEQPSGALGVAPLELEAELLPGDVALLLALHHPPAHPAELVDVHARAVELGVQPRDLVPVGEADRPPRAGPALVLRLVDDLALVIAALDHRHVAVVHAARVALVAAVIEVLAQARRLPLRHVHARDDVGRVVLDGQHAELGQVRHARQRAVLVQGARGGVGLEVVRDVVGGLHHAARVGRAQRLGALHHCHRLQLLLAHDGAHAVLRGHVAVVALDGGEAHEVLAGGADGVHGELVARGPELAVERVLRVPRVEAHEGLGVAQLDHVVVDVQVDPVLRLALDDDGVVAAVLQIGAEEAVGLRGGGPVRPRPDRHHREPARAPHRQPR